MEEVSGIGDGLGRGPAVRLEESCWWTDRLLGTQGPLPFCTMTSAGLPLNVDTWAWVAEHHLEAGWPGLISISVFSR